MKFSLIIPAHNEEKFILKCLNSLVNQSYKNYEVIVINDDSTDRTEKIVKNFQKTNQKIKLIFNKGHSAASSRNKGAKNARGEILIFIDADQFVKKNFLKKILDDFENKKVDALVGRVFGASTTFIGKSYAARKWLFWLMRQNKKRFLTKDDPGCILAVRKKVFYKINGFDESVFYREDVYFEQKIKKDFRVFFDPEIIVYHYDPADFKEAFRHARWVGKGLATDFKKSGFQKIKLRLLEILFWPIFLILGVFSIFIKQFMFSLLIILFPLYYTIKTWFYSKDFIHSFGFLLLSIPKGFISFYSFIKEVKKNV